MDYSESCNPDNNVTASDMRKRGITANNIGTIVMAIKCSNEAISFPSGRTNGDKIPGKRPWEFDAKGPDLCGVIVGRPPTIDGFPGRFPYLWEIW